MMKLLSFENCKLFSSRAFYICLAILVALVIVTLFTSQLLADQLGTDPDISGKSCLMSCISDSSISMLLGIFISIFVCEDYQIGMIRNILSKGYSRIRVFFAKYFVVIAAALIMAIACAIASLITGIALFGAGKESIGGTELKTLLCQLVLVIAYASVYYIIASMLQRTGASIAVCIVLPLAASLILSLIDSITGSETVVTANYWLDSLARSLSGFDVSDKNLHRALISSLIYIGGSLCGGGIVTGTKEY